MTTIAGQVTTDTGAGVSGLILAFVEFDGRTKHPPMTYRQGVAMPTEGVTRLGSTLTDAAGRFAFTWSEGKDADGDTDKEPAKHRQVAVIVWPPHTPDQYTGHEGGAEKGGAKDGATAAMLYSTVLSALRPGATEMLAVRLPRDLLRAAGVLREPSQALADQFLEEWKQEQQFTAFLAPKVSEHLGRQVERIQRGRDFVKDLSALPLATRRNALFVGGGTTAESAQAVSEQAGLKRLAAYAATGRAGFQLSLTDEDLRRVGVDVMSWTDRGTPLPVASICALLQDRTQGPVLERLRDLLDAGPGAGAPVPPGPDGPAPPAHPELTPQEELDRQVLAQIRPIAGEGGGDPRELFTRLKEAIALLQPDDGPADVTSVHDFHVLQTAFPHVWTEAFDARFREAAAGLYSEAEKLQTDYALPPFWSGDVQDVRDFEQFLGEIDSRHDALRFLPVPEAVLRAFPRITFSEWSSLSCQQQAALRINAEAIARFGADDARAQQWRNAGQELIDNPAGPLGRAQKLILELRERLREPYSFQFFQPDSVNYGILTTYRQHWEPETYQVGDLVATMPLAPGETRRVVTTTRLKRSRAEREVENALVNQRDEVQHSNRAESEILRRAAMTTNFSTSAQGSVNFGIGQIGGTTGFALNQADESSRAKRDARESVARAAQEYRRDHSVEISVEESGESVATSELTLGNPNNEITVTYLLYELERRYRVQERIHRLTPVIMVAQEMPLPHQIDDDWLLAHAWILKRVLLDDSFREALEVLQEQFVGDEVAVQIKQAYWKTQKDLVDRLQHSIEQRMAAVETLQGMLVRTGEDTDLAKLNEPDDLQTAAAAFFSGGLSLALGGQDDDSARLEAQRKAVELRLEQMQETLAEARRQLARESSALETATTAYTKALEAQFNRRSKIDQLRVHVKQNILHYMHAIWTHEPPDQRFFRLYQTQVTVPQVAADACTIRRARPDEQGPRVFHRDGERYVVECAPPRPGPKRALIEVADLDRPLGFKGNYMIFPLKECTYLTDFMMLEYVDDYFGLRDPDPLGDLPTSELIALREQRGDELDEASRDALERLITTRLTRPQKEDETIVVPTGQLFMEALPGTAPLLEGYKLLHRGLDVAKVRAEVRAAELENLRYASRLLSGERDDPETDRHVVVEGGAVRVETDA